MKYSPAKVAAMKYHNCPKEVGPDQSIPEAEYHEHCFAPEDGRDGEEYHDDEIEPAKARRKTSYKVDESQRHEIIAGDHLQYFAKGAHCCD